MVLLYLKFVVLHQRLVLAVILNLIDDQRLQLSTDYFFNYFPTNLRLFGHFKRLNRRKAKPNKNEQPIKSLSQLSDVEYMDLRLGSTLTTVWIFSSINPEMLVMRIKSST